MTLWFLPFLAGMFVCKVLSADGEASMTVWHETPEQAKRRARAAAEADRREDKETLDWMDFMAWCDAEDEMARSDYELECKARAKERIQWAGIRRIIHEGVME